MATSLFKPCAYGTCATLVVAGRCAVHARQVEAQRGSARSRGYSTRWERFRDWYLQHLNGLCAEGIGVGAICGGRLPGAPLTHHSRCLAEGRETVTGLQVDHIRPVRLGGRMYDPLNLQVLCAQDHGRKTVAEDGGLGR
jgi:5-methylcytosine-specific restriction endonuclease McrA